MQWSGLKINLASPRAQIEYNHIQFQWQSHMLLSCTAQKKYCWKCIYLWISIPSCSAFNWDFCTLKCMHYMPRTHIHSHCTWEMNRASPSIDFCFSLCWVEHWGLFRKALFITCFLLWNEDYNHGRKILNPSLWELIQLNLLGHIHWHIVGRKTHPNSWSATDLCLFICKLFPHSI